MHSQKTVITGKVNSAPTLNTDSAGTIICDFEVEVARARKGKSPDRTYFHVSVSGTRAGDIFYALKIGDEVTVTGHIKANATLNDQGDAVSQLNLFALNIEYSEDVCARMGAR